MARGLEFSKQAMQDYSILKQNISTNQGIFLVIDKEERCVLRILNSIKDVEKEINNLKGHYKKFENLIYDMIGFNEIRDKLSFLN